MQRKEKEHKIKEKNINKLNLSGCSPFLWSMTTPALAVKLTNLMSEPWKPLFKHLRYEVESNGTHLILFNGLTTIESTGT